MLTHDAVRYRQSESRPLADRLGREEGVEYLRAQLFGNTAAVVDEFQPDFVADTAGANGDAAPLVAHRLRRVDQ